MLAQHSLRCRILHSIRVTPGVGVQNHGENIEQVRATAQTEHHGAS